MSNCTKVGDTTFVIQTDGSIRVEHIGPWWEIDRQRELIALVRDHARQVEAKRQAERSCEEWRERAEKAEQERDEAQALANTLHRRLDVWVERAEQAERERDKLCQKEERYAEPGLFNADERRIHATMLEEIGRYVGVETQTLPQALKEIVVIKKERDAALRRIDAALEVAGGRWEEWGERALSVADILQGGYDDDEESGG